jgi:hypothetical protein
LYVLSGRLVPAHACLLAMLRMCKWPQLQHSNQQLRHLLLCLLAPSSCSPAT